MLLYLGETRIRVTAYIDRVYKRELRDVEDENDPAEVAGYFANLAVEAETGEGEDMQWGAIGHFSTEEPFDSFEEAQECLAEETGIVVLPLPEDHIKSPWKPRRHRCVGMYVREFVPSSKPLDVVLDESRFDNKRDREGTPLKQSSALNQRLM